MATAPTPKVATFAILSVLFSLGLAVLGWGGFSPFFAHPARVTLVVITAVMTVAALFAGGNLSAGVREDRANRWVLPVFGLIGFFSAWLAPYTERHGDWVLDGDAMRWAGIVLYTVGGALRLWPVYVLGNRFSGLVAIQPGHTLMTEGVYRYVRNPSYLGLLVNALGWALVFRSGAGVLLALALVPPLIARIRAEEALLHAQFGDAYDAYCARTWRLIPGVY